MPCSDLYSLAATAVVLLTGKQPDKLYNSHLGQWDWNKIEASSQLKKVLKKMLADRPCDRYQSAEQVHQALENRDKSVINSFISRCRTLIVAPGNNDGDRHEGKSSGFATRNFQTSNKTKSFTTKNYRPQSRRTRFNLDLDRRTRDLKRMLKIDFRRIKPWHWGLMASGIIIIPGLISFVLMNYRITKTIAFDFNFERNSQDFVLTDSEIDYQRQIYQRVESLEIDASAFYKRVDTLFHKQHPELAGKTLTERGDHQQYRQKWYQIASSLLAERERSR